MQKGISLFLGIYVALLVGTSAAYYFLADKPQAAQGIGIVLALLVFGLAYIAHRASGAVGNPFNGLVWGSAKDIVLTWLGGIVAGVLAMGVAIGMRFVSIDPDMTWFVSFVSEQSLKNNGQALPEAALGMMKVTFKVMSFAMPVVGVPLAAAILCLAFLPVYGWLGRRLLANGLPSMLGILCGLGLLSSAGSGLMHNPMFPEHNIALAVPITAVYGIVLTAVLVWLFLMTNSVVVPAVGFASFLTTMSAFQYYYADPQPLMIPPSGVSDLIVLVIIALAMWMTRVPDAKRMAVVAVAFDGTSLNEDQLAALESGKHVTHD